MSEYNGGFIQDNIEYSSVINNNDNIPILIPRLIIGDTNDTYEGDSKDRGGWKNRENTAYSVHQPIMAMYRVEEKEWPHYALGGNVIEEGGSKYSCLISLGRQVGPPYIIPSRRRY